MTQSATNTPTTAAPTAAAPATRPRPDPPRFTNFRISFIWVETIPPILAQQLAPEHAPYAFLGYRGNYAQAFDRLKQRKGGPRGLELPWPSPRGHHFWKYFFGGRHAGTIIGDDAWLLHVPLRGHLPFRVTTVELRPRVTFEVFYSPQGVALVANAYYRGDPRSLDEVVELAQAVRFRRRFHVAGEPARSGQSLDSTAERILANVSRDAFGDVEPIVGQNQPFTITTFVQGAIADQTVPIENGSDEHVTLEALTEWNNYAKQNINNTPLRPATLTIHRGLPSDLVYARARGRAIWLPRLFANEKEGKRLSCYHRNVTLAMVQTLSLGEFVGWVGRRLQRGETVARLLLERAKRAASLLRALGAGDPTTTYRTSGINALIEAAKWEPSMDKVERA